MTRGAQIHDALGKHLARCGQCRAVNAEDARICRPRELRHSVGEETLGALCPGGRTIYVMYLRWLSEPD